MSGFQVRRSETALTDIDLIWLYLARHDLAAADSFLDRLEEALELIAAHPRVGRERSELAGARGYSIAPYILMYRLDEVCRTVDLIRVLDGRRDVAALFDP